MPVSNVAKFTITSVLVNGLLLPVCANAEMNNDDIQSFAVAITAAANAKSSSRVSSLISDDALISVSRKGRTSTLNKTSYLNLLQSNWSKSSQYSYNMQIRNIVLSGNQAKADAITTETITENNVTTRLVTNSRITLSEQGNKALLTRAISQLVIEQP